MQVHAWTGTAGFGTAKNLPAGQMVQSTQGPSTGAVLAEAEERRDSMASMEKAAALPVWGRTASFMVGRIAPAAAVAERVQVDGAHGGGGVGRGEELVTCLQMHM